MAHVIEVETPMNPDMRCDRCGAQAYVEVALEGGALKFCAHHAGENWDALKALPKAMIADHRPALRKAEATV